MTTRTDYGLSDYVHDVETLLDRCPSSPVTVKEIQTLTRRLVRDGSWLADEHRRAMPDCYARHLLHRDRHNRFVVLALVWQPGQGTPVHDHSCWGVNGILEGQLQVVDYERLDDGSRPDHAELRESAGVELGPGSTAYILPPYQDIHLIANVSDEPAISIHIYGRDIDEVHVFDLDTNKVSRMRIKYYEPSCTAADFII